MSNINKLMVTFLKLQKVIVYSMYKHAIHEPQKNLETFCINIISCIRIKPVCLHLKWKYPDAGQSQCFHISSNTGLICTHTHNDIMQR